MAIPRRSASRRSKLRMARWCVLVFLVCAAIWIRPSESVANPNNHSPTPTPSGNDLPSVEGTDLSTSTAETGETTTDDEAEKDYYDGDEEYEDEFLEDIQRQSPWKSAGEGRSVEEKVKTYLIPTEPRTALQISGTITCYGVPAAYVLVWISEHSKDYAELVRVSKYAVTTGDGMFSLQALVQGADDALSVSVSHSCTAQKRNETLVCYEQALRRFRKHSGNAHTFTPGELELWKGQFEATESRVCHETVRTMTAKFMKPIPIAALLKKKADKVVRPKRSAPNATAIEDLFDGIELESVDMAQDGKMTENGEYFHDWRGDLEAEEEISLSDEIEDLFEDESDEWGAEP